MTAGRKPTKQVLSQDLVQIIGKESWLKETKIYTKLTLFNLNIY